MLNGIILAGGRGSRMGPLAAQISKALVSIGQRPHLIHQIELLRNNGVQEIVVVTSPDTDRQIRDLLERANVPNIGTTVQPEPRGPVHALWGGLKKVPNRDAPTIVLMSDTYIDTDSHFPEGDWVGVNPAPSQRSFCYWSSKDEYVDGPVRIGDPVTIGIYRFEDTHAAFLAASSTVFHMDGPEVGMAPFLNVYSASGEMKHVKFESWMDVGDVMALARARQRKFIARAHHDLELDPDGLITKRGEGEQFRKQAHWMYATSCDKELCSLVPRVHVRATDYYTMEYVDLPTLAELWLYWPGRPDTWYEILEAILQRLSRQLWGPLMDMPVTVTGVRKEKEYFVTKAKDRLAECSLDTPWHNRLYELVEATTPFFNGSPFVKAHGDLNFTNILYSLNTGSFKLVDPRGDDTLPLSYELCKLRYSYYGFAEIAHGLNLGPRRYEVSAMDDVVFKYIDERKSTAGMGCLFIAGAPLHPLSQRHRMLERGEQLLRKALS